VSATRLAVDGSPVLGHVIAGHAFQSYGIRLTDACTADRDEVLRALADRGISCRRGIPPIHLEPLYLNRDRMSLPITEAVAAGSIFLPMYASLTESDQDRVIETVIRSVAR